MALWSMCIFLVPIALGEPMATQQVQAFEASFTSELQRLLPGKIDVLTLRFDATPTNVSALFPSDVSNSTVLGFLSGLGIESPNGIISCVSGWLKIALKSDIAKLFRVVAPPFLAFAMAELGYGWCESDQIVCGVFGALAGLLLGLAADIITPALDGTIFGLVLCVLNIQPPSQVTLDSLKAFAKDRQQMEGFGRLLRSGHGFEAGFKLGSVLQEPWSMKNAKQQSLVV